MSERECSHWDIKNRPEENFVHIENCCKINIDPIRLSATVTFDLDGNEGIGGNELEEVVEQRAKVRECSYSSLKSLYSVFYLIKLD